MKKFILFLVAPFFLNAQDKNLSESEVPSSVRSGFDKMFPGVSPVSWERENYGLYEAELDWKGHPASATFNANGLWMRTEKEVKESEMPPEVMAHARKMYPDFSVAECQIISTPDVRTLYEVEMFRGTERQSLIFDSNNAFLRIEVDEDDDDKGRGRRKG